MWPVSMIKMNMFIICLAALIPILVGFFWYSKMLFGNAWMRINRFREEDMKGANMALIFGCTIIFSLILSFSVNFLVIHQFALPSIVGGDPSKIKPEDKEWLDNTMMLYGNNFRSFKHGALHGGLAAFLYALPILGIPALFERRGWKYILIHFGYWFVTLTLMGGVLSEWNK